MINYLLIFLSFSFNVFALDNKALNDRFLVNSLLFDDNRKLANSNYFYLGEEDTIPSEINENVKVSLEHKKKYKCNYPFRYLRINKKEKIENILRSCPKLASFYDSFQKQFVSLTFATESINGPASSFGHILIVFHDNITPDGDADVIEFSARPPENIGAFEYLKNGIFGKFDGYYSRKKYSMSLLEYSIQEQRNFININLNYSRKKIDSLILSLYEVQKIKLPYYFFTKNCAYFLSRLLGNVDERFHKPKYINAPFSLFKRIQNKSAVVARTTVDKILLASNADTAQYYSDEYRFMFKKKWNSQYAYKSQTDVELIDNHYFDKINLKNLGSSLEFTYSTDRRFRLHFKLVSKNIEDQQININSYTSFELLGLGLTIDSKKANANIRIIDVSDYPIFTTSLPKISWNLNSYYEEEIEGELFFGLRFGEEFSIIPLVGYNTLNDTFLKLAFFTDLTKDLRAIYSAEYGNIDDIFHKFKILYSTHNYNLEMSIKNDSSNTEILTGFKYYLDIL